MASPVTKYAILRVAKLTTVGNIAASGEHTFRERPTPNANPAITPKNAGIGATSAAELVDAIRDRVDKATERAKEPVLALEYLVTASPEAFKQNGGQLNAAAYFNDALAWLRQRHGAANVVCAYVHQDEATPHLVAYVVPLVERAGTTRKRSVVAGRNPDGSQRRELREFTTPPTLALSAKHFVGGRATLSAMQTDFAADVGKPHGLQRGVEGSKAMHQRVKRFYRAVVAAQQPAPSLTKADAWEILKGNTPDTVKRLAGGAAAAAAALSAARTCNQSSDRIRAAEAAKMAKEREALKRERGAFELERTKIRGEAKALRQEVADLEQTASAALVKVEQLETALASERAKSADLLAKLAAEDEKRNRPLERQSAFRGLTPDS